MQRGLAKTHIHIHDAREGAKSQTQEYDTGDNRSESSPALESAFARLTARDAGHLIKY